MAHDMLTDCVVCGKKLVIKRLQCPDCGTVIEGDFVQDRLSSLSRTHKDFIEVFVRCRGNIKEVEKELGVSYPTVRAKLDEVITAMGYPVSSAKKPVKEEILERLRRGEISREEAMEALKAE